MFAPSAEPGSDQLFHPVIDAYGKRLALVFGNHAPGGECPFSVASLCHHCDIGMGEGMGFDLATNRRRLDWYQSHFHDDLESVAHLVIYNSGSVLNPAEMPFEFLLDVLALARRLASVRVVSLDSRESFVTVPRILRIAKQLRDDQCARVILGIESADDGIRNKLLEKGMSLEGIRRAFDHVADAAEQVGRHRVGIDVNILVGGPGTTSQSAAVDAVRTASFALVRSQVSVDFNIHPYYPSSRGLIRFPNHSRCSTPVLFEAVKAIVGICETGDPRSKIFVGVNDEGHDTDHSGRMTETIRVGSLIQRFNATQNIEALTW